MKPIIGITVDAVPDPTDPRTKGTLKLNWNYAQAVSDHGGVPILIPPTADMNEIAGIIDGWLIPGGNDIDAKNWGEENHPEVSVIEEDRFTAEQRLMNSIRNDMPVLGICYGCQFINVSRGGSLHQHLPDLVGHDQHRGGTMQEYCIEQSSKLGEAIGSGSIEGKSYHHQAVRETGRGLRVVAKDEAGLIEAVEATDRPWMVGVQWHPERTLEDERTQNLFHSFIEAASEYAAKRRV